MRGTGLLRFLNLMANARLVLTDSGGIQEETTILGVPFDYAQGRPCLTLRKNTERPVTVTQGTNTVVGCDPALIVSEAMAILDGKNKAGRVPELWDGRAAGRIVKTLVYGGEEIWTPRFVRLINLALWDFAW